LKDIEKIYGIEIPPYINDVKLEIKGTTLDLPIFRRPARPMNQSGNPITIGLLRNLCGEADKDAITRYHNDEPCAVNLDVSVFAIGHGEHFPSSQPIMPAKEQNCNCSLSSAYRNQI
jgi:hypothetical protein